MSETINKQMDIVTLIIEGMQEIKGENITIIDMSGIEMAGTPYFVICSGNSTTHVSSISDKMQEYIRKKNGRKAINVDGERNCEWVIVDYGEAMAHIFIPEARERYALEQLWSDGVIKKVD